MRLVKKDTFTNIIRKIAQNTYSYIEIYTQIPKPHTHLTSHSQVYKLLYSYRYILIDLRLKLTK